MWFLAGFGLGLIVGWNFLTQPAVVKTKVDELRAKYKI